MVAIVSGNTLGLLGGSSATLGQQGTFGNAAIGKSNEHGYLNVSNGNVVMQQRDDFIASKGADFALIRTYNAQGALGQHWKFGLSREVGAVTGTLNEAGSTVVRTAGDGSEALYRYDSARAAYVSTDGDGAYDTLSYDAASQRWTWQAGSGGAREVYDGQQHGRIISSSDDSGTGLSYFYDASSGLLSSVVNASGDTSWFDYTDGDLAQVRDVLVSGEVVTRVRYAYDGQHRLVAVTTDLTPADNNVDDGNMAVTSYTYDGGSERVASVTQADGSALLFSYQQVGGEWRVASVTDGLGRRTELAYDLAANTTRVTDALGAVTAYAYDAQGQLVGVTNPAGQQTSYAYDDKGNLIRRVDARGNAVDMEYDANGNQVLQRDALGNTVTRTYDPLLNTLLTETRYQVADPDGAGPGQPGKSMTARYAYDDAGRLRFLLSAEGRLTQHLYNAEGERIATWKYIDYPYDMDSLAVTEAPSEAVLAAWLDENLSDRRTLLRYEYDYDSRGLLISEGSYEFLGPGGDGQTDLSVMRYVYDQAGQLLQTIDGMNNVTSFVYDGLGRLLSTTDSLGNVTLSSYEAGGSRVVTKLASGLSSTLVYNTQGELTDRIEYSPAGEEVERTSYAYDADGRLRMTTGQDGARAYLLYDEAGRKAADITAAGVLTQYRYDADGRLTLTVQYANAVGAAAMAQLVIPDGAPLAATLAQAGVLPVASDHDQREWRWYDAAGRLQKMVNASGVVSDYEYDGASQLVQEIVRATSVGVAALVADPDVQNAVVPSSPADRSVRRAYDGDGLLHFEIDSEHYLTEYFYNEAALTVATLRYATRMTPDAVPGVSTPARKTGDVLTSTYYDNRGLISSHTDAEGYTSIYVYDAAARVVEIIRRPPPDPGPQTVVTNNPDGGRTATTTYKGQTTVKVYDSRDMLLSETWPLTGPDASGALLPVVNRYSYDTSGKLVRKILSEGLLAQETIDFVYDSAGKFLHSTVTANGSRFEYDEIHREVSRSDLQGNITLTSYQYGYGMQVKMLSRTIDGLTTINEYNARGSLIREVLSTTGLDATGTLLPVINRYSYTDAGKLAQKILADGLLAQETTDYTYDAAGRLLQRVVVSNGNRVVYDEPLPDGSSFSYQADGGSIETKILNGLTTILQYDANGRLISETLPQTGPDASGKLLPVVNRYSYNAANYLIQIIKSQGLLAQVISDYEYDESGKILRYSVAHSDMRADYNNLGRIVSITNKLGHEIRITYDENGLKTEFSTVNGSITISEYDAHNRLFRQTLSVTGLDASGVMRPVVYLNFYDDAGRRIKSVMSFGLVAEASNEYVYDQAGKLLQTIFINERGSRFLYDELNRIVLITNTSDDTTSTVYESGGGKIETKTIGGLVQIAQYDAYNRLIRLTLPETGPDASGKLLPLIDTYTYDAAGRVTQQIAALGLLAERRSDIEYDQAGNVVRRTHAFNGIQVVRDGLDRELSQSDAQGNIRLTTYHPDGGKTVTNTVDGRTSVGEYNAQGRFLSGVGAAGETATTSFAPDGSSTTVITETNGATIINDYNAQGLLSTVTLSETGVNAAGIFLPVINRYSYDDSGKLTQVISAAGLLAQTTTGYTYDLAGVLLQRTVDANGQRTVYDALGRVVTVIDVLGNTTLTSYDDGGGKTVSVTVDGLTTIRQYDARNLLIRITLPETGLDAAGTLLSVVNRYSYNAVGQKIQQILSQGLVAQETTDYTYGADGELSQRAITAHGTRTAYDTLERVVSLTDALGNVTLTSYNADGGWSISITLDGRTTVSDYDAQGRLTGVTLPETGPDAAGMQLPIINRYSYNAAGQLSRQILSYGLVAQETSDYAYDADGNLLQSTVVGNGILILKDAQGRQVSWSDGTGKVILTTYAEDGGRTEAETDNGDTAITHFNAAGTRTRFIWTSNGVHNDATFNDAGTLVWQVSTSGDEVVEATFRDSGKMSHSVTKVNGKIIYETTFDEAGTMVRNYMDRDGEIIEDTYFQTGQMAHSVTTVNGKITSELNYDEDGTLIRFYRDQDGTILEETYDDKTGNLAHSVTTVNGIVTAESTYDATGRLLTSLSAEGVFTTFERDARGNTINIVVQRVTPSGLVPVESYRSVYDENGIWQETTQTGVGFIYVSVKDKNPWRSETDALGNVTLTTYDRNHGTVISVSVRDARGLLTSETLPETGLDANGALLPVINRYQYDDAGKLIRKIQAEGLLAQATLDYAYDTLGRLVSVTDQHGNSTITTYHEDGSKTVANTVDGRTTTSEYDTRGLLFLETLPDTGLDANGIWLPVTNQYTYNAAGKLDEKILAAGLVAQEKTTYAYDAEGNLLESTVVGDGYWEVKDALDRQIYWSKEAWGIVIVTAYMPDGGRTETETNRWGTTVKNISATDLPIKWVMTDNNGEIGQYDFNQEGGLLRSFTMLNGETIRDSNFDGKGTMLRNFSSSGGVVEESIFYPEGHIASRVKTVNGVITEESTFNEEGRIMRSFRSVNGVVDESIFHPSGGIASILKLINGEIANDSTYREDGTPIRIFYSENGVITEYIYHPTGVPDHYIRTVNGETTDEFRLNDAGVMLWSYSSSNGVVTETTYNADTGNPLKRTTVVNGETTVEEFDDAGRLVKLTTKDGGTRYVYDGQSRQVFAIDDAGKVLQTVYDEEGRLQQTVLYAAVVEVGDRPSLQEVIDKLVSSPQYDVVTDYRTLMRDDRGWHMTLPLQRWGYDANGNRTPYVDTSGNGVDSYLNLSNGNMVIRQRDDIVASRGIDLNLVRAYNAQGAQAHRWTFGISMSVGRLTGEFNGAGSTVVRTAGDGSQTQYTYDSARGLYVTTDGAGAYQTLAYDAATQRWTWQAGDASRFEIYDAARQGRIITSGDASNNRLSYIYGANDGLLSRVESASGDATWFDYDNGDLVQVRDVLASGAVLTRVRYGYDQLHRLTSVTTDLTPDDNSVADGNVATITYTYEGSTEYIASVTQADGTSLAFGYEQYGSEWRVISVTDGLNRRTEIRYPHIEGSTTSVYDSLGGESMYSYDEQGQLTSVTTPAGQKTTYAYDSHGNLSSSVDARGNTVHMEYDANGNQTLQRDELGNTITRTYDPVRNLLLTETTYQVADPDGAGPGQPGRAQTVRHVYDEAGHLRFQISAQGRVVEYRYNAAGERTASVQYAGQLLDTGTLAAMVAPDESQMLAWVAGIDNKSATVRQDYEYDVRGLLARTLSYGAVDAAGAGIVATQTVQRYVYDQAGQLLQSIDGAGGVTSFVYDGLGRLQTSTDAIGNVTLNTYDAAGGRTATTLANGLKTASVYNKAGELTDVIQLGLADEELGRTSYTYDANGRLRMTTGPTGLRSYVLYDEAGRKAADITAGGTLTQYAYDENNQLIGTVRHATAVGAADLARLVQADGTPLAATLAQSGILPADTAQDQHEWRWYDAAGRLQKTVGAAGAVTDYVYDRASRLIRTIARAEAVNVLGFSSIPTLQEATAPERMDDRIVHREYDDDGLLRFELDAERYLTEYRYDSAGRQVQTVRYFTQLAADALSLAAPAAHAKDIATSISYDGRGMVQARVDGEGYVTNYSYDAAARLSDTSRGTRLVAGQLTQPGALQRESYSYDLAGRLASTLRYLDGGATESATLAYDSTGLVTAQQIAGVGATIRHDLQGRVIAQLSGRGSAALAALGSNPPADQVEAVWQAHAVRYAYDQAGLRTSQTDANGNRTLYLYDAEARLTHTVNALGEVRETVYNVLGQVSGSVAYARRIDAGSLATLSGGLITDSFRSAMLKVANPGKDSHTAYTYFADGALETASDALGIVTSYGVNAFGEQVSRLTPIAAGVALLIETAYDRRGQLTGEVRDRNGLNLSSASHYDAFGRVTESIDANLSVRRYDYDRNGRMVAAGDALQQQATTSFDAFGNVLAQTDRLGQVTQYSYTAFNRQVSVTTPEGLVSVSSFDAQGRRIALRDAQGATSTYHYDLDGNLDASVVAEGSLHLSGTNSYDAAGRLTDSVDAGGRKVHYEYDAANRLLTRRVDPEGLDLRTTYAYDAKGQQILVTDAAGVSTEFMYRMDGQKSWQVADVDGLRITTTYDYDDAGRIVQINSPGSLVSYAYDILGRRTEQHVDPFGLNLTTLTTYDGNGNVTSVQDPNGNITRYRYDANDRRILALDAMGGVSESIYDANGNLAQTIAHARPVTGLTGQETARQILDLLVTDAARDVRQFLLHDRDGRLAWSVDGTGAVVHTEYDGKTVRRTAYASRLDAAAMEAVLAGGTPAPLASAARDVVTQQLFDDAGRLVYSIDGKGAVIEQRYDGSGNTLVRIAYAAPLDLSQALSIGSVARQLLALAQPARDARLVSNYDAAGRVTYSADAQGAVTGYSYDSAGNLTRQIAYATALTPPLADDASLASVAANAADRISSFAYDALHRQVYAVDALGGVTKRIFDGVGNVVRSTVYAIQVPALADRNSVADMNAIAALLSADVSRDRTVIRAYDHANRLQYSVDPLGYVTQTAYDANGNATELTRHAEAIAIPGSGQALRAAAPASDGTMTAVQIQDVLVTDAARDVTERRSYDAAGRLYQQTRAAGSTAQAIVTYGYDALGNATSITNERGLVTVQEFDQAGRKTVVSVPLDGVNVATTRTAYDAFGNAVKVTDPKGNAGYFYYDQQNRLVLQVNPLGHATATSYTLSGKPETVTEYKNVVQGPWSEALRPTVAGSAADAVTRLEYDRNDRLVQAIDAVGATEVYGYDALGNRSSYQNKLGGVTLYTHDGRGAVLSETLPVKAPDAAGTLRAVVNRYAYDAFGNRSSSVEAEQLASQRTTTYGYDLNGHLVHQQGDVVRLRDPRGWPESAPVQAWTYDERGNKTSYTDANGSVTHWYYDAAGRKTAELSAGGTLSQWRYDAAGNMISSLVYNTPVSAPADHTAPQPVDPAGRRQTYYVYDNANRLVGTRVGNSDAESLLNGDPALNVQWAEPVPGGSNVKTGSIITGRIYDALGNVIAESDARGATTWSYYNAAGSRIAQVDGENYLTTWEYDSAGNVLQAYRHANRVSMPVSAASSVDDLRGSSGTSQDDRIVVSTYDGMNRVVTESTLNQVVSGLDANGTLSSVSKATLVVLAYDGLGNVLRRTEANGEVTDATFDALGRQVLSQGAGYTDFENTWVRPTTKTDYDGLGNVITSTALGKTRADDRVTRYTYDAGGALTGKTSDGIAGGYAYAHDGAGNVTEVQVINLEADSSRRVDATYIEYDAMNREVRRRSGPVDGNGLWTEGAGRNVAYNAFGEVIEKGINGSAAEFAEYDDLGRRWKTNAGDGSTKVYQYDQNGNAVILIQSAGANLRPMTLAQILSVNQSQGSSVDPLVVAAMAAGGIDITLSTYDKRNQLTDTYQATMQSAHNFVTNTPFLTQELGVNFTAGSLTVGGTREAVADGAKVPAVTGAIGYTQAGAISFSISWYANFEFPGNPPRPQTPLGSRILIPAGLVNGTGKLHVRVDDVEIPEAMSAADVSEIIWQSKINDERSATYGVHVELFQEVQTGTTSSLMLLAAATLSSVSSRPVGYQTIEATAVGSVNVSSVINIRNQPTSTDRMVFMTRPAGSSGAWATSRTNQTLNTQGAPVAGWFQATGLPVSGNYEYQYIALGGDGTVLNVEFGVFDSGQGNSNLMQTAQAINGVGKAFFASDPRSLFGIEGRTWLHLTEQGKAQSMRIHYREVGSSADWQVAMIAAEPNTPGWFKVPFTPSGPTEYWFETYAGPDGTGAQINAPGGGRTMGTFAYPVEASALTTWSILPATVAFNNQPDNAARMSLVYTVRNGASGTVDLAKSGANSFVWNASDVAPDVVSGSYIVDYSYEAFDVNGQRVNAAKGELGLGVNPIASTHHSLARAAGVSFTPPVPAATQLILQYRNAGSLGAYTRVVLSRSDDKFFWDMEAAGLRPQSGSSTFEYSYTLLDANGQPVTDGKPSYDGTLEIRSDRSTSVNYSIWTISVKSEEATIHRKQSYNAFGEISSETDGNNHVTDLYYDTVGQLTHKVAPMTTIALENGDAVRGRPETLYYYDASSQLIGVRDANGNLNTQTLLPGFAGEGRISSEFHADGGVKQAGYDIFGNLRTMKDELGRVTSNTYDQGGRLIQVVRPPRVEGTAGFNGGAPITDRYTYDTQGNRTSHTNSAGQVERTGYDAEGRVVRTLSFEQREVSYTYTYDASIKGVGMLAIGGWKKVTTVGGVRSTSDSNDYFGHLAGHVDVAGRDVVYGYDHAAHLIRQTSSAGQEVDFEYYANGYLKRSVDRALRMESYFEYDKDGNRTHESYAKLENNGEKTYYQIADITYDELNRVVRFKEQEADITYTYDANGNRRQIRSTYNTVVNGAQAVQDYWYQYDGMNRFTITKGVSANGMISNGATGTTISYDLVGQRLTATAADGTVERYSYTSDGYLEDVTVNGVLAARRENDALGRVTGYNEYRNGAQLSRKETRFDADNRVLQERHTDTATGKTTLTDFDYGLADGAGGYSGVDQGVVTHTFQHAEGVTNTGVHTTYQYVWWDDAKQSKIQVQGINAGNPEAKRWASGFSEMQYDVNGHVTQMYAYESGSLGAVVGSNATRSMSYTSDQYGQVLRRNKTLGNGNLEVAQRFYYLNGHTIGDVSSEGPSTISYAEELAQRGVTPPGGFRGAVPVSAADFDQNYQPINSSYPGGAASAYTVRQGDTLASIARAVWGDESLWYLIADANGLVGNDILIEGQVLTVPNKVSNFHNNATTFKVYNAGQAIGDSMPVLPPEPMPPPPPAKKGGCGVMGTIIMVVVAVAVVYLTAGAATNAAAAMLGETIAAGAAASTTATVLGGAMAGALGSVASQVVGMSIGAQNGFNWKGVALGALGGAVSAGVMNTGMGPSFSPSTSAFARGVVQGGISSTITQGVAVATGLQHSFSWRGVAAGAIAGGVGAEVGNAIGEAQYGEQGWAAFDGLRGAARDAALWSDLGKTMVRSAATSMASGVVSSLVRGGSLRSNLPGIMQDAIAGAVGNAIGLGAQVAQAMAQRVATDAFGNALGSSLADSINSSGRTLSPHPISNFSSIAPIDASGPQVDVKALLDSVSGPIMVDGDFMTPEQMDVNHRAAAAESDAAMREYLDKSAAQNGQRLANGVDQLLKGIKPLPTLMESPVTGRFGNLMDLSREDRQISDARASALAAATGPQLVPIDDAQEQSYQRTRNRITTTLLSGFPGAALPGAVATWAGQSESQIQAANEVGGSIASAEMALVGVRRQVLRPVEISTSRTNPLDPVLTFDKSGNEVMYRTMSEKQFEQFSRTGQMPPTTETSISPSLGYSSKYDGVAVQITVKAGTSAQLQDIGIAVNKPAQIRFPDMSTQTGDWMQTNAQFKTEKGQMTTQLGQGKALDIFNRNIVDFIRVPKK